MTPARRRGLRLALAGLAATALGGSGPPLPAPDLSQVEPVVRRQLEAAQAQAARLESDPDADPGARAESLGSLGRLYLVYSLLESAEACFSRALALHPQDFRWNYYLGAILQRRGRLAAAGRHLGAALAARPRDLPALVRLGQVEIARQRPRPAALAFQRALEIDPSSAAALFGLAQVAALDGDDRTAVRLFESVLRTQPEASTAHYQLGLALRNLGDLERARFHLGRAGRSEVTSPDPLMNELSSLAEGAAVRMAQATRARGRGDLATAQAALEAAVAADPENLTARQALASNLIAQGRLDRALGELQEVLRRDPGNAAAHYNLGTARAAAGQPEAAIAHLERAVELAPDFAAAQANLAELLRSRGRHREALAAFDRALELEPDSIALAIQRAEVLHRLGREIEAAAALGRAAPAAAGDAALLSLLGQAYETLGDDARAGDAYRRAIGWATGLEAAEPSRRLGLLMARQEASDEALTHLDAALEARPDWTAALADRALLHGRRGNFAAAAADFARIIALDPADEAARMGRAVALLLAESYSEALAHLEESLVALPDSLALRHSLARLLAACPDATIRDGARALELAQQVARRERNLEHGQTLAMALAESGRHADAAALQRQLLEFAQRTGQGSALPDLRRRLAAYERGEPVRAPWLDRGNRN